MTDADMQTGNGAQRTHELDIRAESIEVMAAGGAYRRGRSEIVELGTAEGHVDSVGGLDQAHAEERIAEHAGESEVLIAERQITRIGGDLTIDASGEDSVIMAGTTTDVWHGGAVVAAAMSDDLAVGAGVRMSAPLDVNLHGVLGLEERPGTCEADALNIELYGTLYEREYGPAVHNAAFAKLSGVTVTTMKSGFRPLMRQSMGVRNTIPGGDAAAPEASPPPSAASAPTTQAPGADATAGGTATLLDSGRSSASLGARTDFSDALDLSAVAHTARRNDDFSRSAGTASRLDVLARAGEDGTSAQTFSRSLDLGRSNPDVESAMRRENSWANIFGRGEALYEPATAPGGNTTPAPSLSTQSMQHPGDAANPSMTHLVRDANGIVAVDADVYNAIRHGAVDHAVFDADTGARLTPDDYTFEVSGYAIEGNGELRPIDAGADDPLGGHYAALEDPFEDAGRLMPGGASSETSTDGIQASLEAMAGIDEVASSLAQEEAAADIARFDPDIDKVALQRWLDEKAQAAVARFSDKPFEVTHQRWLDGEAQATVPRFAEMPPVVSGTNPGSEALDAMRRAGWEHDYYAQLSAALRYGFSPLAESGEQIGNLRAVQGADSSQARFLLDLQDDLVAVLSNSDFHRTEPRNAADTLEPAGVNTLTGIDLGSPRAAERDAAFDRRMLDVDRTALDRSESGLGTASGEPPSPENPGPMLDEHSGRWTSSEHAPYEGDAQRWDSGIEQWVDPEGHQWESESSLDDADWDGSSLDSYDMGSDITPYDGSRSDADDVGRLSDFDDPGLHAGDTSYEDGPGTAPATPGDTADTGIASWEDDDLAVEQALARGALPEDFDASELISRWMHTADTQDNRMTLFAETFEQAAHDAGRRIDPRLSIEGAMDSLAEGPQTDQTIEQFIVFKRMHDEVTEALDARYGYRANDEWVEVSTAALDAHNAGDDSVWREVQEMWALRGTGEEAAGQRPDPFTQAPRRQPGIDSASHVGPRGGALYADGGPDSPLLSLGSMHSGQRPGHAGTDVEISRVITTLDTAPQDALGLRSLETDAPVDFAGSLGGRAGDPIGAGSPPDGFAGRDTGNAGTVRGALSTGPVLPGGEAGSNGRGVRFGDAEFISFPQRTREVSAPPGWRATRNPEFNRAAASPGEFPFSMRESYVQKLMAGEALSEQQVATLDRGLSAARAQGLRESRSQRTAMARLLGELHALASEADARVTGHFSSRLEGLDHKALGRLLDTLDMSLLVA